MSQNQEKQERAGCNAILASFIMPLLVVLTARCLDSTAVCDPPDDRACAGKRHQQNLAKRAARDAAEKPVAPAPQRRVAVKKTVRIGRPGYRVTKQFDPEMGARGLLFQVGRCAFEPNDVVTDAQLRMCPSSWHQTTTPASRFSSSSPPRLAD